MNTFLRILLALLIASTVLLRPDPILGLNQMTNFAFTGNATGWTLNTDNGLNVCGNTGTATTGTTHEIYRYENNMMRIALQTDSNTINERDYISQQFTVPGTGTQLVRGQFQHWTSTGGSWNASANTSWVRVDVWNSANTSHVAALGCKSFNSDQATSTVGGSWNASLTGGTTYTLRITIQTQNSAGNVDINQYLDNVVLTSSPVNMAVSLNGSNKPALTWDVSTAASGASAIHATTPYKVYRGTSSGSETFLANATTNSYTDTSVSEGTTYYYWVTNLDTDSVESASSTELSIAVPVSAVAPTVTTQAASAVGPTTATLNGNITSDGGGAITQYGFAYGTQIQLNGGDTATTTLGAGSTGAFNEVRSSLTENTVYYFRPYATNAGGTGYGTKDTFTTTIAPAVPTTFLGITGGGIVNISGGGILHVK